MVVIYTYFLMKKQENYALRKSKQLPMCLFYIYVLISMFHISVLDLKMSQYGNDHKTDHLIKQPILTPMAYLYKHHMEIPHKVSAST